jgi:hypothetical protein
MDHFCQRQQTRALKASIDQESKKLVPTFLGALAAKLLDHILGIQASNGSNRALPFADDSLANRGKTYASGG